jgi:cell division protein ZapA (FtsZ GTPase activity inhibitor)
MPEITIHIGGRDFEVVCKDGEEPFLQSAAALLDTEAQALTGVMGRIPEARMLLMSGLMLADKTASLEDQLAAAGRANEGGPLASEVTAEIAQLKGDLKASKANLKTAQDALTAKEKELADEKANVTSALEAMERMVASLQKQGA